MGGPEPPIHLARDRAREGHERPLTRTRWLAGSGPGHDGLTVNDSKRRERSEVGQVLRVRRAVADFRVAVLAIEAACRGVEIDRGALDLVERFDIARPQIDKAQTGADAVIKRAVVPAQIRERMHEIVGHYARRVARITGTGKRQDEIGPLADAPNAKRLSEILVMRGNAHLGRNVYEAGDTQCRIDDDAAQRLSGAIGRTLQHVVSEGHRLA